MRGICGTILTMAIVGIFIWWYSTGWRMACNRAVTRLRGLLDYFSIDLLLKTLFSPFRQISAGKVDGPINIQLRAFFDRLLSRVIGAIVRTMVILIGIVSIIIGIIVGLVYVLAWALIPLTPLAGLTAMLAGWMPWM